MSSFSEPDDKIMNPNSLTGGWKFIGSASGEEKFSMKRTSSSLSIVLSYVLGFIIMSCCFGGLISGFSWLFCLIMCLLEVEESERADGLAS